VIKSTSISCKQIKAFIPFSRTTTCDRRRRRRTQTRTRTTKSCCRQSLTICAINYCGRASGELSTQLTDDGPVYHALSVHRSRAKLIARSTIDMPRRNKVRSLAKSFTGKCRCFCRYPVLNWSKEASVPKRRLIRLFLLIEHRPVTDTDTDTRLAAWRSG